MPEKRLKFKFRKSEKKNKSEDYIQTTWVSLKHGQDICKVSKGTHHPFTFIVKMSKKNEKVQITKKKYQKLI